MKEQKIKVVVIDPTAQEYQVQTIENDLAGFYGVIGCDLIDITERQIDGHYYDFIVDDEGLMKTGNRVSAVDSNEQPALVGTLIIANHDDEGNESSLTDDDITAIIKRRAWAAFHDPDDAGKIQTGVILTHVEP